MITYEMKRPGSSHAAVIDFDALTTPEKDAVKARARLAYVYTLYVENDNQERYGDPKTQLSNNYTLGKSNFTATLQEAHKLMNNYVGTNSTALRACA